MDAHAIARLRSRAPLLLVVIVLVTSTAVLLDRTWRFGEAFSPADLLFQYYPWAYDAPHTTPSNALRSDEAFYHQPLVRTHWPRLLRGEWPDLDPFVLAGVPAFAQGILIGLATSPLSLPFNFMAPGHAEAAYAGLRLVLAGLLMFAFLRSRACGAAGAVCGALAFGMNGCFITWLSAPMPTAALWLPGGWLLVERFGTRPRPRTWGTLALLFGLVWMAGYPPTAIACSVAIGAYAIAVAWPRRHWRALVLLLAAAGLGLLVSAVCLLPLLASLADSPLAGRRALPPPVSVDLLVTFLMPNFFGSPALQNYWRPGPGNFGELVNYIGVVPLILAVCGAAAGSSPQASRRSAFFAVLAVCSFGMMYTLPPFEWLSVLPGFRQMNPMRWNVVLAASTAVLAGYGTDWLGSADRRIRPHLVALFVLLVLIAFAASVSWYYLDSFRAFGRTALLRREVVRFCVLAGLSGAFVVVRLVRSRRGAGRRLGGRSVPMALGMLAMLLVMADVLSFGYGFNPTLPPERLYPVTPGLRFLMQHAGNGRLAPVDRGEPGFAGGHVWSVYGLPTVIGYDFKGDALYQRFLARADGRRPFDGPRWDYVPLLSQDTLDLRLLGLLGVEFIVLPPADPPPPRRNFVALPELVGRQLRQTFVASQDNLRRVDVLTATYDRENAGTLSMTIRDDTGATVASHTWAAHDVPNNDWLRLEFPPVRDSRGRRYLLEITTVGAVTGHAVTAWATVHDGTATEPLAIDGRASRYDLWFRTFSGNDRLGDATLVYARDLNIYRNPHAMPRAWFAERTLTVPLEAHLEALTTQGFDGSHTVVLDRIPARDTAPGARVRSIVASDPDHPRVEVDAPAGGVLVVSERFSPGWHAYVDGEEVPVFRADSVLMAVEVPAGGRVVSLAFEHPWLRTGAALSLSGVAVALLALCWQTPRRTDARSSLAVGRFYKRPVRLSGPAAGESSRSGQAE